MNDEPKVQALLLCNEVRKNGGLVDLIGVWHSMIARIRAFPWRVSFQIYIQFTEGVQPEVISIKITDAAGVQIMPRGIEPAPTIGELGHVTITVLDAEFPAPGNYTITFDADGISPTSCVLEVLSAS